MGTTVFVVIVYKPNVLYIINPNASLQMTTYCPFTIGTTKPIKCQDGCISNIRCPWWQQAGEYLNTRNLMSYPAVLESELCQYVPSIMQDFDTVGMYHWECVQWPAVKSESVTCILTDANGNRYTANDVIRMYEGETTIEESDPTDDGEGTTYTYN